MEDETGEENDEEVMRVPEDFKIAASDDLHGGGDDQNEGQSDDDTCQAGDGGEDKVGGNLLRMLRRRKSRGVKMRTFIHSSALSGWILFFNVFPFRL